jgi:hypothetical protein
MSNRWTLDESFVDTPDDVVPPALKPQLTAMHARTAAVARAAAAVKGISESAHTIQEDDGDRVVVRDEDRTVVWRSEPLDDGLERALLMRKVGLAVMRGVTDERLEAFPDVVSDKPTRIAEEALKEFRHTPTLRVALQYLSLRPALFPDVTPFGVADHEPFTEAQMEERFESMQAAALHVRTNYPHIFDAKRNARLLRQDLKCNGVRDFRLLDAFKHMSLTRRFRKGTPNHLLMRHVQKSLSKEENAMTFSSGNRCIAYLTKHYAALFS